MIFLIYLKQRCDDRKGIIILRVLLIHLIPYYTKLVYCYSELAGGEMEGGGGLRLTLY